MHTEKNRSFLEPKVLARLERLPVCARTLVEGTYTGRHKSPHRGASVEFAQYRKYAPGDDVKSVDWRVYGRTDRFYVKEFEADTNLRCHLVLDCSGSMGFAGREGGITKFDYARRLAATLAHLLSQQGDAVGLHAFNHGVVHDIPPRTNPRHLGAIYDTLETATPAGETAVVKILHDLAESIRRRAMVVVFSDLFTEPRPLLDCFEHLVFRKHDLAVFHVLDPQELTFDLARPSRLVCMESRQSLFTDPAAMRDRYLACLHAYLAELRRGCLEFNVDYRLADTAKPYEELLAAFLLARQRHSPGRRVPPSGPD